MNDVTIPKEIEHLDFDLEEEHEEAKTCSLNLPHPAVHGEYVRCGLLATWELQLNKPCKHNQTMYLCQSCYQRAVINSDSTYKWHCTVGISGAPCGTLFHPRAAIVSINKIK